MEAKHKSKYLANVLGIKKEKGEYDVLEVEPYNPEQILSALDTLIEHSRGDTQWVVNVTGGTKVMSQMAFTVFSETSKATIYYWPDTNDKLLELFPYVKEIPIMQTPLINLADYLLAHGYTYTSLKMERSRKEAEYYWNLVVKAGDVRNVPVLEKARNKDYVGTDKNYLSGGWFEEWLYYHLQEHYQLHNNQVGLSVKLHDIMSSRIEMTSRELDVVYVHNHNLYFWEAKVYTMSAIKNAVIMKDLFKLSAVRQMLGLKAQANFAVAAQLFNNEQRKKTLKDLSRTLNLQNIFDINLLQHKFQIK